MKKLTKILSVVVILALLFSAIALVACTKKTYVQQTETGVVFTVDSDIMADVEGKHLIDYLKALQDKGELTFSAPQSTYGSFLEEVNGIKADSTKVNTGSSIQMMQITQHQLGANMNSKARSIIQQTLV